MKTYAFTKRAAMIVSLVTILSVSMAACAGPNRVQTVSVKTTPPAKVQCVLKNDAGAYNLEETPGSVKVKRSLSDLEISCLGNGFAGNGSLTPTRKGAPFGNVEMSRLVNGEASRVTGTSHQYPKKVLLTVTQTSPEMANTTPSFVVPSRGSAALPQAGYIEQAGNSAVISPEQKPLQRPVQQQQPIVVAAATPSQQQAMPPVQQQQQQQPMALQQQRPTTSAPAANVSAPKIMVPSKQAPTSIFYTTDLSPKHVNDPVTVRVFEQGILDR